MSRWSDLATWVGPTPNQRSGHVECRGLVVHIAEGFYQGTISWQKNPSADVSSHFVVDRDGTIGQVVDTDDTAWTQRAGNGHWLSVECAGFTTGSRYHSEHPGWESLTPQQIEAIARLLVRGHQQYGYPLQLASSPSGHGLGHHSMGAESGVDWGHSDCPGEPIKAQKPAILARALQLAGVPSSPPAPPAPHRNLEDTVNALPVLRKGSIGSSVRILEGLLIGHSYPTDAHDPRKVDGIFGGTVESSVKALQRARGLDDDGIVGPATWPELLV